MRIHKREHPLAGHVVTIQSGMFKGRQFHVMDYWDRLTGMPWLDSEGYPQAMAYAVRNVRDRLPLDNQVLFGRINGFGHIIHESEMTEMSRSPNAILMELRAQLDLLTSAGRQPCDGDQHELMVTLVRVAALAVDLDSAMTAGRPLPEPWQRAATRARARGWDSPLPLRRQRPAET